MPDALGLYFIENSFRQIYYETRKRLNKYVITLPNAHRTKIYLTGETRKTIVATAVRRVAHAPVRYLSVIVAHPVLGGSLHEK
jgi:hypothetical protein